ncbi:MAG TPA: hypothetical protein VD794_12925 [Flavisolibacter sp.]|nr:hypothetical protein [Flavisolibacter sp.]
MRAIAKGGFVKGVEDRFVLVGDPFNESDFIIIDIREIEHDTSVELDQVNFDPSFAQLLEENEILRNDKAKLHAELDNKDAEIAKLKQERDDFKSAHLNRVHQDNAKGKKLDNYEADYKQLYNDYKTALFTLTYIKDYLNRNNPFLSIQFKDLSKVIDNFEENAKRISK